MSEGRATIGSGSSIGRSEPWSRLRRDAFFFLVVGLVVALDQLTKQIVRSNLAFGEAFPEEGIVRIVHVANSGAAFGILQGQTIFLTVTTLLGLAAILLYYLYPPMEHALLRTALGLQLGGAIGNLTDRVRLGEVTDFVDFRYWPAFNVADSSIVIGVATIVIFFVFSETAWQRKKTE